jgi:predicted aspartyl protease
MDSARPPSLCSRTQGNGPALRPNGVTVIDKMGIFRTRIEFAPLREPENRRAVEAMVDTGSAYNWVPRPMLEELGIEVQRVERFETANGTVMERDVGHAMIYAAGRLAPSIVVFGEPGDMTLLGAIGLEGLNLRVDLNRKELVPAGPLPVAAGLAA